MDYIAALKNIVSNYDAFCLVAKNIEWISIKPHYDDWFYCALGMYLYTFEFPQEYIQNHPQQAYVRALFSRIAFDEEWDNDFWNIPQTERTFYLEKGSAFYKSYAIPRELRLIKRDWNYLANEMKDFAQINKIPFSKQKPYIEQFEHAAVIEIGGVYHGDSEYLAIKDNHMLMVNCGCWD